MKFIRKQEEPAALREWKAQASEDWTPRWEDLRGDEKQAVFVRLLAEQGWLCCYCECRIEEGSCHIEHLRPRCGPDVDPLHYGNMLCSCQGRSGEPQRCGHLKGDWYDSELFVSPLDEECERRFGYHGDGRIFPASQGDAGAAETILRLGLGIAKLNALRREAVGPFLEPGLTNEEFTRFVAAYLKPGAEGRFGPFHTTIRYLFNSPVPAAP